MENFTPKGEDVLRQETIDKYGFDDNNAEHKPFIDNIVADRLKDENMKASLHKQKTEAKKKADELAAELEEAKKSKGTETKTPTKEEIKQIVAEEQFIANGGTNTALRQLHKVMAATGKNFWDAQKDSLYVAFKEKQEKEITSRQSQLPPSRGGSTTPNKEIDTIASRNEGNLPPGFEVSKK